MAEANADWRREVDRAFFLGKTPAAEAGLATPGGLDRLALDLIVSEEHTSELEVTDNPVETGVVVSDHAFMRPDRLELEGVVSDVSMRPDGTFPSSDPFTSIVSRSATAWQVLKALQASAEPFDVQTGLQLYQSMVIEKLTARQDAQNAAWLVVSMTLRQVLISTTQAVTYPPRKSGKTDRQASKTVAGGDKATTPVTEEQKQITFLKDIRNDPTGFARRHGLLGD